ncbi:hypothetical protein LPJ56_000016 [Coemansia sp. RSA 2599]|nr:hypothetical protein LPJ75_004239 [Coemansia sp. RSA 2598]KAJ1829704.1 hypothetical protein LPJ56_000016 [Coemansia sp. RSA 2599]
MDAITLTNEQVSFVVARTFSKLWMPRGSRESLQPFQVFCYELLRSTQIAVPIVMLTLLYVNKFKQRFPGLHGGSGSEYRMFVVALMLASKYLEDNTFTTQTWSEVSHLPAKELTIMQREFLMALDHRLHVPETEYNAWITQLQTIVLGGSKGIHGIMLASPKHIDIPSPVELQVVPSPMASQYHEPPSMDMLPTPPAKRMRPVAPAATFPAFVAPANAHSQQSVRLRPVLEPICIPSQPVSMLTPPLTSTGFAQAEFTFQVPSVSAAPGTTLPIVARPSMVFAQQQPRPVFSAPDLGYSVSSAAVLPAATTIAASQQHLGGVRAPASAGIYNGNCGAFVGLFDSACGKASLPGANSFVPILHHQHQQQQQQHFGAYNAAAAAAALATQYPAMYYNTPSFGFGSGAASTFPVYTYSA